MEGWLVIATPTDAAGQPAERRWSLGLLQPWRVGATERILELPSLGVSTLAQGFGRGGSSSPVGSLVLANADGGLTALHDLVWEQADLQLYHAPDGAGVTGLGDMTLIAQLTTSGIREETGGRLVIDLRDRGWLLDRPLALPRYAGTGGAEGPAELKDRPKPFAIGPQTAVEPVEVDRAGLIYQVHARAIAGIDLVTDKGVALTHGGDIETLVGPGAGFAELQSFDLSGAQWAGKYITWHAGGMFRLARKPVGLVVADFRGDAVGGYVERPGAVIRRVIEALHDGPAVAVDDAALDALDAAFPHPVKLFTDGEGPRVSDWIETVAVAAGAVWWMDWQGRLTARLIDPDAAATPLQAWQIAEITRGEAWPRVGKLVLGYRVVSRVHSADELAEITAGDIAYSDGTPIEALKPAEPGATQGAVIDDGTGTGNVRLPDGTPVNNMMLLVKDITVAQLPAQGTHDGQLLILDDPADGIPPVWYQWDAQSNQWVKRAPASLPELDPVRGSKLDGVEAGATKSRVVVQATAPTSPTTNDLWYDTTARRLKRWDGSAWVEVGSLNTGLLADRDDVDVSAGHLTDGGVTLPADKVRNDMLVLQNDGTLKIATGTVLGQTTASGLGVKALGFKDRITAISDLSADIVVGDALRKTTQVSIGQTNPIHISGNDAVWSGYRLWVGADTPQDAPFCVDQAGKAKLVAPEIYDAAGNLVFDGTKFTGLAQTQAAEPAPVGINPYTVSCADDGDIKQVELTVQSSVTAKAAISLKNRTSTPAGSYPATVTLTIQRRPVGQSTWTTVGTATFTKTTTTPGAGQYQVASIDMTDPEPRLGGGTITISYDTVVAENGLEVTATETVPAGMWEYRVTCSQTVGRALTLTDNTGGGFVVAGASAQQGTGGTYLPIAGGTITGNLAVSGDLTVSGDLVTVSSQQVDIGDNILRLNAGLPPTSSPTLDAGIEIERGTEVNVKLLWDETNDRWVFVTPTGSYKAWHDGNAPATATRWPTWTEVTGKPSTFAPSAHTHTAADIVGGSGSGLDADKLDGLESTQFLRSDVSLNVISAVSPSIHFYDTEAGYERRTYIGRWRNIFSIQERDTAGVYVRAPFVIEDGLVVQLRGKADGTWTINNNVIWHAGNDGAGSGLDADKLDGLQGSQFLRADVSATFVGGTMSFKQGSNGSVSISTTNQSRTGWINWYYPDSTRAFFIGYADQTSKVANWWFENGTNLAINGTTGSGRVGIGTTPDSAARLTVSGDLKLVGAGNIDAQGTVTAAEVTATSDERLKTDIRTLTEAWSIVRRLRGVRYRWKGISGQAQGPDRIGLIAQEVLPHVPEVVHERGDGTLTIDYGALVGLLIEAIKEQDARLDAIEARLAALEGAG